MKKTALALTIAMASSSLQAADLMSAYEAAKANDAQYAQARADFEAAGERLPQGRSGLLPSVSLSGNYTYNWEEQENEDANTTTDWDYSSYGATLSLTQPLYRRQNWIEYDQSKLQVSQAEAAFAEAEQNLILRLAEAYFGVLQARADVEAAEGYQSAVASQLNIAREAFDIGTGIKTDVHDAETRYANATTQLIAAQTALQVQQQALAVITGVGAAESEGRLDGAQLSAPEPLDLDQWVQRAMTANNAVQQQSIAAEIARRDVERQRAGHHPTVDLVLSTGYNSTLDSGDRENTDDSRIALQFNLPLYQGGAVSSRTREASSNLVSAQSALDYARRSAGLLASQSYLGVVNGLAQIQASEQGLESARNAVVSNKDAFDLGVRLNIDVLNAQSQVFTAERDLNRVKVETLLAQLRLEAAAGTLTEEDVRVMDAIIK
ncbi:TolC family outer membrane protein [Marinobacterium sp. YM272]|uniref:TolC family outer membrane protein n=1 Tax=Marinobacterium sp. YM272 TaxID=3421654 RepID=UPI003D7F52AE